MQLLLVLAVMEHHKQEDQVQVLELPEVIQISHFQLLLE
jgi:hypothetical protein|tara:strand:- start:305 stop:421 length:117 start_codon:yes stop_codon:yes gene_type:complete